MSKLETHLSKSEQRTARLHILTERIRYQLPARTHGRTQIHTYGCCQTRGCKEQSRGSNTCAKCLLEELAQLVGTKNAARFVHATTYMNNVAKDLEDYLQKDAKGDLE